MGKPAKNSHNNAVIVIFPCNGASASDLDDVALLAAEHLRGGILALYARKLPKRDVQLLEQLLLLLLGEKDLGRDDAALEDVDVLLVLVVLVLGSFLGHGITI